MLKLSRRDVIVSAAFAAALGLDKRLAFIGPAQAQKTPDPAAGFHKYKVGSIEVTAIYDGIWEKPHDPAFIKNASVDDTKAALGKAGLTTEFVSIPLTVVVLKVGDRTIMIDSGSGGQWQPTAGKLAANMQAAGIDPGKIGTILISHFHPDHIFGLMQKGTNAPVFPNAELVVNATEYKWWTEPGRVEKLPEPRKPLGLRINSVFPGWKNFRLVEAERGGSRHPPRQYTRPHARPCGLPRQQRQPAAHDLQRYGLRTGPVGAASGVAGCLRPGRAARRGDAAQAHRPRHRREDDDLRRPLPLPGRRLVRQGRQRLRLHGRQGMTAAVANCLDGRRT